MRKEPLRTRLDNRWFLYQHTDDELFELYEQWGQRLYLWVDPTADSLHLGNFVQFMHALQYMLYGNKLILVVWWATGMIWDPGWKDAERNFLDEETLQNNVEAITEQVWSILKNLEQYTGIELTFEVVNNIEFYENMRYVDFLRKIGKHMTVNSMVAKESVKARLEDENKFISYTEFSYMLMQAYDYLRLFKSRNCRLQIGASDQWWNIVTGVELIRKKEQETVFGATCPLLTTSSGKKFGKSEWNAIRLDAEKNSPYVCYNYFMNSEDSMLETYLNTFTLLDQEEIQEIIKKHNENPNERYAQQRLAYLTTAIIYGEPAAKQSQTIKEILYDTDKPVEAIKNLSPEDIIALNKATSDTAVDNPEQPIRSLLIETGLCESNADAKRSIKANAITLNGQKITDINFTLTPDNYINTLALLKKWKKSFATVRLV